MQNLFRITVLSTSAALLIFTCYCNSPAPPKAPGAKSDTLKTPMFTIHSYMEKDTITSTAEGAFHVDVTNKSHDTLKIFRSKNVLTFLPCPGWKEREFRCITYNGPEYSFLNPGDYTDCGYDGLQNFEEMPAGKSVLHFELKLFIEHKTDPVILEDSMTVYVKK